MRPATRRRSRRPRVGAESSSSTACSPRRPARTAQPFEQEGTCTTPSGESVSFRVNDEDGGSGHGVRVFAGARWDPFILDAPAALKTVATGKLAFTELGAIYMDGKNVLGLVVEIDAALLGGADAGRRRRRDADAGTFNVRIERVGRPEVKNMMLGAQAVRPGQPGPGDPRPVQHGGRVPPRHGYQGAYRARLNANLAFWDGLDGKTDWPSNGNGHPLTELVLADYLVVDVTKPYAEKGSFLEIELAARAGGPHETCGGRAINDDVMDNSSRR